MRKLIFATQKLDPDDPVLAATVPMVRALAARVDELVVLCDSAAPAAAPANARVGGVGARTPGGGGAAVPAGTGIRAEPASHRRRRTHGSVVCGARRAARSAAADPARPLVHPLEGPRCRARRREGVHRDRVSRRTLVSNPLTEDACDRARDRPR